MEKNKKKVLDFLRSVSIMSLSVNSSPNPINTVLLFAVDDDFTFYFATHSTSFKAKAIQMDPQVSLSVWEHKKMLVQATGTAHNIVDEKKLDEVLDKLTESASDIPDFWPPLLRLEPNEYSVYKIKVDWLRKLDLSVNFIKDKEVPIVDII